MARPRFRPSRTGCRGICPRKAWRIIGSPERLISPPNHPASDSFSSSSPNRSAAALTSVESRLPKCSRQLPEVNVSSISVSALAGTGMRSSFGPGTAWQCPCGGQAVGLQKRLDRGTRPTGTLVGDELGGAGARTAASRASTGHGWPAGRRRRPYSSAWALIVSSQCMAYHQTNSAQK